MRWIGQTVGLWIWFAYRLTLSISIVVSWSEGNLARMSADQEKANKENMREGNILASGCCSYPWRKKGGVATVAPVYKVSSRPVRIENTLRALTSSATDWWFGFHVRLKLLFLHGWDLPKGTASTTSIFLTFTISSPMCTQPVILWLREVRFPTFNS